MRVLFRQQWMAWLVALVVLFSSSDVLARAESSAVEDIHAPNTESSVVEDIGVSSLAAKETAGSSREEEAVAPSEVARDEDCYDCKPVSVEAEAPMANISAVDVVSSTDEELAECERKMAKLTQAYESLETVLQKMEKEYTKVLNETYTEVEKLEQKIKHQQRQLDANADLRTKLGEANAELRFMHESAMRRWVNVTNIQQDIWRGLDRRYRKLEKQYGRNSSFRRRLRPRVQEGKRVLNRLKREVGAHIRHMSCLLESFVRSLESFVDPALGLVYSPIEPAVKEAKVAIRLSTISAIEETSKGILNYLEKNDKQPEGDRISPMQRQLEYKRRNRKRDKVPDFTRPKQKAPSVLNLKARIFFKHTLENSEKVYADGVALIPLAIALSVTRSHTVGCFALLVGIPNALIWAFALLRFIRRAKG